VVWCAIGNTGRNPPLPSYAHWHGTLSSLFNVKSGVLISWTGDGNKNVPETIAHLLNTLVTASSVELLGELDIEKEKETVTLRSKELMQAAKQHSQRNGGTLQDIHVSIDDAATALATLVVDPNISIAMQAAFIQYATGQAATPPDDAEYDSEECVWRSLMSAAVESAGPIVKDSPQSDVAVGLVYRSLMPETGIAPRRAAIAPYAVTTHIPDDDAPTYRHLAAENNEDEDEPVYRSGACEMMCTSPCDVSDMDVSCPNPAISQPKPSHAASVARLLRLASPVKTTSSIC